MPDSHILSFGPYQLDMEKVRLWCDTQPVRLTPKAFQVLCYVVERPGQLVTKEELFRVLWADTVVSDAALTTCIQEIRKALQDNAKSPQYLETVHRRGFRFIGQVVRGQELGVNREESSINGQGVDTVMPTLRQACPEHSEAKSKGSGQASVGIQKSQAQAASESPWIPAFAGTPQPASTPP